jgi:hypothetical protein
MAIRLLRQKQCAGAVLSALIKDGLSRRQAYRYLLQAQSNLELRPVPEPRAVFTVSLPRRLIGRVRARCRQQRWPISGVVAELLRQWLEQQPPHG